MNRLGDSVSVVTGAASGIGRGIALLFAREGSHVIVADIASEEGKETVTMINNSGGDAIFIRTDVSKSQEVNDLFKYTIGKYGKLDILCNNAGILAIEPPLFVDLSEEDWTRIIDNNLKSVFLCCKYAVPEMMLNKGGSIINISSIAGLVKSPHLAYAASKGGIISLTRSLSLQLAIYNIRANVICPGGVLTPGTAAVAQAKAAMPETTHSSNQRLISRIGTPEDIAYTAVYLASSEATWVTGSVFSIDGGSMRG